MIPGIASAIVGSGSGLMFISVVDGGLSTTATNSRTVSFTPPAGTTLAAFVMTARHNATAATWNTPTFNGTNLTAASAWAQYADRYSTGIYYVASPTTGSAQDLVYSTTAANWASTYCAAYYFFNQPASPIGTVGAANQASVTTRTVTMDPADTGSPFLVGAIVAEYSSGGSSSDNTFTSLSNLQQDGGGTHTGNTAHAIFSNRFALSNPGSTAFAATSPSGWNNGDGRMVMVEIKSI